MTARVSLQQMKAVLLDAAAIAARHFGRASATVAMKQNATPVTSVDKEISALLQARLTTLEPDAAWLGEEDQDGDEGARSDLVWVVDPLDGTKEFIRAIPEIGVSVALVRGGKPVVGGIVNPITGEIGLWSEKEGMELSSRAQRAPPPGLAATIANASRTEYEKGSLAAFSTGLREIRPIGSVAYKLLRIASGRENLYFSVEPKSEWDICAGAALVSAAGLDYRRFDGEPIAFGGANSRIRSGAVAGPARLVDDFLQRFASEIAACEARIASGAVR